MGAPGVTGGLSDRITALSRRPRGARLRRRARPVVDRSTAHGRLLWLSRGWTHRLSTRSQHTVGVVPPGRRRASLCGCGLPLWLHRSVVTVLHTGIARPHHRPRYRLRLSASPDADQPVSCPAPFYALTTKRNGAMSWGTSACSMEGPSRVQPRRSIRTVLWSVETGRNLRSNRSARWLS